MISALKALSLAALVSLGAFAAAPATAHADGYLGLGGGRSGPSVEFFIGDGRRFGHDDYDRRDWRRDRREERHWDRPRGCSVERALRKAERFGVRRARVLDVGRRTIEIGGRDRYGRVFLTFSRAPGCPLIGR